MSFSCFSDFECSEESGGTIFAEDSPVTSSESESPAIIDEAYESSIIAGLIEEERNLFNAIIETSDNDGVIGSLSPSSTTTTSLPSAVGSESSSRSRSVAWILKVKAFYGFHAVTAYLAVNYLHRFLSCHHLPQTGGWPLQLLSVACLSLAAKMEEPLVPSLLDLQVESSKYVFEPKTIQRMELVVLNVLKWRLQLITPFNFTTFFAYKLDATEVYTGLLISRSRDIILSILHEATFLDYWPSSIAAAATLCAANEIPNLSFITPEHAVSWCNGLCKENFMDCYKLMQEIVVEHSRRKSIKVIPQIRVKAQITKNKRSYNDSSPSSSSTSSTSSLSPYDSNYKRRRLNNNNQSWLDDDHDV